jgi:hypothetical protein
MFIFITVCKSCLSSFLHFSISPLSLFHHPPLFMLLPSLLPPHHPSPFLLPMHSTLLIPFSSYLIIPNFPHSLSHSTSSMPPPSAPTRYVPSLPSSHPLYHSFIPSLLNPFTSYFIHPSLPPLVRVSIHNTYKYSYMLPSLSFS